MSGAESLRSLSLTLTCLGSSQVEEAVDDVFDEAIPEADEAEDTTHVTLNFGGADKAAAVHEAGDAAEKIPLTTVENDAKS